jgi:DNA-binding response OmpR family regulator
LRLLVIEDSDRLRDSLCEGLRAEGYVVDAAADGARGLAHLCTTDYDAAVLDLSLPKMDGMDVLREARRRGLACRVLVLTARDSIDSRVAGLRTGADDYLVKPFAFEELLARLNVLVRRRYDAPPGVLCLGDLELDMTLRRAKREGRPLDLTAREFAVLEYLVLQRGKPVSRDRIEEHIYDDRFSIQSNSVVAAISTLRRKMNERGMPNMLFSRRNVGYYLSTTGDDDALDPADA